MKTVKRLDFIDTKSKSLTSGRIGHTFSGKREPMVPAMYYAISFCGDFTFLSKIKGYSTYLNQLHRPPTYDFQNSNEW